MANMASRLMAVIAALTIGTTAAPPPTQIPIQPVIVETKIEKVITASSTPQLIDHFSNKYSVNADLAHAIARAESRYRNECNKEYGCIAGIGPFQIVQSTFDEQCLATGTPIMTNIYQEKDNVQCGIKMISERELFRWEPSRTKADGTGWESNMPQECSCIRFLRSVGVPMPIGLNAQDLLPNSTPGVGAVILLTYKAGHAALITGFDANGLFILEGNYKQCEKTSRYIRFNDPAIRGFYRPAVSSDTKGLTAGF